MSVKLASSHLNYKTANQLTVGKWLILELFGSGMVPVVERWGGFCLSEDTGGPVRQMGTNGEREMWSGDFTQADTSSEGDTERIHRSVLWMPRADRAVNVTGIHFSLALDSFHMEWSISHFAPELFLCNVKGKWMVIESKQPNSCGNLILCAIYLPLF